MAKSPTPIEEAATHLLAQMETTQRAKLRAMARTELIHCHFGLAAGIRNSLGLWDPHNPIIRNSEQMYPDDCSRAIVDRMWEKLQAE